jgi:hypothetical protein
VGLSAPRLAIPCGRTEEGQYRGVDTNLGLGGLVKAKTVGA